MSKNGPTIRNVSKLFFESHSKLGDSGVDVSSSWNDLSSEQQTQCMLETIRFMQKYQTLSGKEPLKLPDNLDEVGPDNYLDKIL